MFELRPLSREAVPAALAKAERYRLLNEPRLAESICLDVLDTDPGNQQARITLLLALTDQFGKGQGAGSQRAREVLAGVEDEYDRTYYSGLVCERQAMALMTQRGPRSRYLAYDGFRSAMERYSRAAELRPGDAEADLRWNTCARILNDNPYLVPEPQNVREQMLE